MGWTHWRADESSRGRRFFEEGRATVVPISSRLWRHLADIGEKTLDSYGPDDWPDPPRIPPLDDDRAAAVRLAVELRLFGKSREVRLAFASQLSRHANQGHPWLGPVVGEILKSARRRRHKG